MIVNDANAPPEELKMPPVPAKDAPRAQQPPLEAPPPYSAGPSTLRPPPSPIARQPSTPSSVFRPQLAQTVNHFELFSNHDAMSGTFLIDPLLPSPPIGKCRRRTKKRDKVWGKGSRAVDINASFRTRHGAITLDLEVVAQNPSAAPGEKVPAHIVAGSTHGRTSLDVHSVHPSRSIDLFVETTHGKIVLMLPPTFDGPLVFRTRHSNSVSFLPEFAARTRTIRANDSETVLLCSPPGAQSREKPLKPINQMADDPGDRCYVRTKHGKIIVGISGADKLEEPAPAGGLFKAIGRLFESQGRAFGQYVESQARTLEKVATERGAMISQYVDARMDPPQGGSMRTTTVPRIPQAPQPPQSPQPRLPPQAPQPPQMPHCGGIASARGGMCMQPDSYGKA
ncbi:hypothetical protein L226DRAFT_572568 [Lentinus tigrinus ALCF2SS1-7]|uniref:DUF7330 domain-containing protein n=1 Tax=Lentinus tigrinus ALCF2SS1-6 TaxID=1328759 RepID=A0A5C2S1B5_9APHY|nr:hypothetical protein L227DRAFT_613832 [Lentinus tigrinus ALCF2SS1-6]RPD73126.1 hypothetical protein L226DRAFT_572568 [Lentinus tigrinus ALCF2SS1-7]